jgi:uncharacterized membrane protein YgcG
MRFHRLSLSALLLLARSSLYATAVPMDGAEDGRGAAPLAARQATTSPPSNVDVTRTITQTVSRDSVTTTISTTIFATITSTIVVTTTEFVTSTITSSNVDTATSTNYVTSTVLQRRWIESPPETGAKRLDPSPTPVSVDEPVITGANAWSEMLFKKAVIEKRATILTTVTVIIDGIRTITNAITSTVIVTTSTQSRILSTITSVTYANAKTTITVTSTLTVTSTSIDMAPPSTVATAPTGNYSPGPTGGNSNTGGGGSGGGGGTSGSSGSSELSTGAKAGIGAGVGAVGLIILVALGWWFYKRRAATRINRDDITGSGFGMSEVPVGPSLGGGTMLSGGRKTPDPRPGTTEIDSTSVAWKRVSELTGSPPLSSNSPTPVSHAAVAAAELGIDRRPNPHSLASEIDSRPVMTHSSGPVHDVYEMPAQNYR